MTNISKRNIKKTSGKFFMAITLLVCIALSVTLADLFSSIITVGGFNLGNAAKANSFDLYAISLHSTVTKAQADDLSGVVKSKNGAGYVWQGENCYYVFASCYENASDADKVASSLRENSTECEIVKISLPKLELDLELDSNEKTALENAIGSYKTMYKKLYDLSVSIDTNQSTEIQGKMALSEIISAFAKIKSNYELFFNPRLTSKILNIKLSLINIETYLNELSDFSSLQHTFSAQVKYTYFKILTELISVSSKII